MDYLSPQSFLPLSPHLLFVQPYVEAKKNWIDAFSIKEMPKEQRVKHILVGLVLSIPLINTIALLILRAYHFNVSSQKRPIVNDEPFAFWPFDRPMPKLLTDKGHQYAIPLDQLTPLFLDSVFSECVDQKQNGFTLATDLQGNLIVKYQDCIAQLTEILEHVNWSDLDEKWQKLNREELQKYCDQSLIFETLRSQDESPLKAEDPFIRLYTSYGFYSWLNPLLRKGYLHSGVLNYATPQTNAHLLQKNQSVINRIAKELLFISLAMTASLNGLPQRYEAKCRVIRVAHIPKDILHAIQHEEAIQDRGFLSASAPGGGFAGGGPCDEESCRVKFVILSKKGKHVSEFSLLSEHEVLFRPFTKFKILKRSGDEVSGFRIELEEILPAE